MARGYPDFEGNKSGLYLKPEWAAFEGIDKTFTGGTSGMVFGDVDTVAYVVPVGKKLYITQLSFGIFADDAADADNNQIAFVNLSDSGADKVTLGGNGGGIAILSKPMVVVAGHTFRMNITAKANHTITTQTCCQGYEVTV